MALSILGSGGGEVRFSGYSDVVSKLKSWVQFDLKGLPKIKNKKKRSTIIGPHVVSKQKSSLEGGYQRKN